MGYIIHKRVRVPYGFDYNDAMARIGHRVSKKPLDPGLIENPTDLSDRDFIDLCCLNYAIRGEKAYQKFEAILFEGDDLLPIDYEIKTIPITLDFDFNPTVSVGTDI